MKRMPFHGKAEEVAASEALHGDPFDRRTNPFEMRIHVMIAESNHLQAKAVQTGCPRIVPRFLFRFVVLRTVDLHHQRTGGAVEINDVIAKLFFGGETAQGSFSGSRTRGASLASPPRGAVFARETCCARRSSVPSACGSSSRRGGNDLIRQPFGLPPFRGPAGLFSLKTVHRTVFRALEPLKGKALETAFAAAYSPNTSRLCRCSPPSPLFALSPVFSSNAP